VFLEDWCRKYKRLAANIFLRGRFDAGIFLEGKFDANIFWPVEGKAQQMNDDIRRLKPITS
jgi:hypothetical protein